MYNAFGLLTPASEFTLDAARDKLAKKFPAAAVAKTDGTVTLTGPDWDFQLFINDKPDVLTEHQAMAEKLGGVAANPEVAACGRRVEVWSNTNDPFLEHFNDFISIIEVLQSFPGVIAVDPKEPAFM